MPNALVIGGTGMLGEATRGLVQRGYRVGVIARNAQSFAQDVPGLVPADADWANPTQFRQAVRQMIAELAPIDLALVWTHDRPRGLALAIAEDLDICGGARRFVHVMGSAVSDPARPDVLEKAEKAFEASLPGAWVPVCLGFVIEADQARWLTNEEISAGVLQAIDGDSNTYTIGQTRPWAMKP